MTQTRNVHRKWLGHGRGVAEKHYLQVTDDDWTEGATKQAIDLGGNAGGNTLATVGAHGRPKQNVKKPVNMLQRAPAFPIRLPRKDSNLE